MSIRQFPSHTYFTLCCSVQLRIASISHSYFHSTLLECNSSASPRLTLFVAPRCAVRRAQYFGQRKETETKNPTRENITSSPQIHSNTWLYCQDVSSFNNKDRGAPMSTILYRGGRNLKRIPTKLPNTHNVAIVVPVNGTRTQCTTLFLCFIIC